MMNIQLIPVVASGTGKSSEIPARKPWKLSEILNEAVAVLSLSLRPTLGAATFLMWLVGLV